MCDPKAERRRIPASHFRDEAAFARQLATRTPEGSIDHAALIQEADMWTQASEDAALIEKLRTAINTAWRYLDMSTSLEQHGGTDPAAWRADALRILRPYVSDIAPPGDRS